MKYLVNIKPLEAYMFGTDQKFKYPEEKLTGKESYFIKSNEVPEQTTILGLLRSLILKQKGLFRSSFWYNEEEKKAIDSCIGSNSFCFEKLEKQDFGYIKEISPIFLMDEEDNYYVKNPFHNKKDIGYAPLELTEKTIETSVGRIRLPKLGEYDAKKGYASGYYNLKDGSIHNDIFSSSIIPGNRKSDKGTEDDSFFKKEIIKMKSGYSFAVYVDLTEDILPKKEISYMGLGKSAFLITSKSVKENNLIYYIKSAFSESTELWTYALSDLFIQGELSYDTFCIVEEKRMRNLETLYNEKNHVKKLRRSEKQFNMIQKGSVFFGKCNLNIEHENCKQIGYNQIVELGGK